MHSQSKIYGTGSNPYYLNINNTAKEFSNQYNTNADNSLLDAMSKVTIIADEYTIENPMIVEDFYIIDNP